MITHGKDDRDASSNSLGAIKLRLAAQKQLLFTIRELPRGHRGTIQVYGHRLAGVKFCGDRPIRYINCRLRDRWGDRYCGRLVRAVHGDARTNYLTCAFESKGRQSVRGRTEGDQGAMK